MGENRIIIAQYVIGALMVATLVGALVLASKCDSAPEMFKPETINKIGE